MKTSAQNAYKLLASVIVFSVLYFLFPAISSAQGVQDFTITSFDVSFELSNSDPQGLLKTNEKIMVNFNGQNQGILRAIPNKYGKLLTKPEILSVTRDGIKEPYTTYIDNDNTVLRIGVAGTFITGLHNYEITYSVENVISFYNDYDELYWDVNGNEWLQSFDSVSASLRTDAQIKSPGVICYTGVFGSQEKSCGVSNESNSFEVKTTKQLGAGETLSVVSAFEKGYFKPAPWWEQYKNFLLVSPLVLVQAITVRRAHKKWRQYGKDYKRRGITVPYFGRPKGISVMQASYVQQNKFVSTHITASLIDLAIRGYLKITEKKERFSTKHELTLLRGIDNALTVDESLLLKEMFGDLSLGAIVKLEDKKNKLYKATAKITKLLDESTLKSGYYEASPATAYKKVGGLVGLGIILGIIGLFFAEYSQGLTVVTGIVTAGMVVIYASLMTKRSQTGNMMVEHMDGLKLYLKQAESDRIAKQDAVEAPLAPLSGAPVRDVVFFEKLLPFAVAMGVEKSWAGAFKDIYTQPPDWYGGSWNNFSSAALVKSISGTNAATTASFSPPTSSGGSGFSGGGGSGGGGGGGGGGGW